MTDLDENLAPEPATDVDPRSLDIEPTAEEFFVLSRLNGSTTIGQICKTSGLGTEKTLSCVQNLRDYGLIRMPGGEGDSPAAEQGSSPTEEEPPSDSPSAPSSGADPNGKSEATESSAQPSAAQSESSDATSTTDIGKALRDRFPVEFSDYEFDVDLLEQSVELDEDFKREVLFVHAHLDSVDHYRLLGVEKSARRRELRRAYFPLSKRFHPDRFYQKILGDFDPMIQRIFQRVTKAYQTLSDRNKRQEYDASLHRGRATHATPRMASTPASRRSEPREAIQGNRKRKMAYKVLVQRADRAMNEGRIASALKEYRKALTLQRDIELPLRVARSLLSRDDYLDDAISFARTANNIDGDSGEPLKLMGELYEKKGQHDDALYHYQQAFEANPDDSDLKQRIDHLKG